MWSYTAADAVITIDGDNPEYRDNLYGYDAYYEIDDVKKPAANINGSPFLVTGGGNSGTITAYNDGDDVYNQDNPSVKNSPRDGGTTFSLSEAGSLLYDNGSESVEVVAFYLSANQQGNDFYGLNKLEIYTSENATVDNITDARAGELVYKFDSADNGRGQLRLYYGSGNSNWDVVLYVPLSDFTLVNNDYQQTYIQFVVGYDDAAGHDSWQYNADTTLIPEPSSSLLISLGGILGLLRRRR
jgi:hypothetical protein